MVAALVAVPVAIIAIGYLASSALIYPRWEAVLGIAAAAIAPWRLMGRWTAARLEVGRVRLQALTRSEGYGAAPLIGLFAVVWTTSLRLSAGSNPNYSDTVAPAMWRAGELALHPGTIQFELYPHLQLLLPHVAAWMQAKLGLPILGLHDALGLFAAVAGLAAIGVTAARLAQLPGWAGGLLGCVAVAALIQGWVAKQHFGYPVLIHLPIQLLGAWGLAAVVAATAWWLFAPKSTTSTLIAFGLAGLIFNLHSTYGVIFLGVLLTAHGLGALRPAAFAREVSAAAIGLAAFLAAAAPQAFMLLSHTLPPDASAMPQEAWWTLMAARKPFHVFIWGEHGVGAPLAWLAAFWLPGGSRCGP